jgi:hypothetical protein
MELLITLGKTNYFFFGVAVGLTVALGVALAVVLGLGEGVTFFLTGGFMPYFESNFLLGFVLVTEEPLPSLYSQVLVVLLPDVLVV